jgi:hypothetical protein
MSAQKPKNRNAKHFVNADTNAIIYSVHTIIYIHDRLRKKILTFKNMNHAKLQHIIIFTKQKLFDTNHTFKTNFHVFNLLLLKNIAK